MRKLVYLFSILHLLSCTDDKKVKESGEAIGFTFSIDTIRVDSKGKLLSVDAGLRTVYETNVYL